MEEITKTATTHYSVKIEGWQRNGSWLGRHSIGQQFKDLEEAKDLARDFWKEANTWHFKQVSVADIDGSRVWAYVNTKEFVIGESGQLIEK